MAQVTTGKMKPGIRALDRFSLLRTRCTGRQAPRPPTPAMKIRLFRLLMFDAAPPSLTVTGPGGRGADRPTVAFDARNGGAVRFSAAHHL